MPEASELPADTERGSHRSFRVGSDDHVTAPGRHLVPLGVEGESLQGGVDAGRFEIGLILFAEVVGRDGAHECWPSTERGNADGGVRDRATGNLAPVADDAFQPVGRRDVDERHPAVRQTERGDRRGLGVGEVVHQRVADAADVEAALAGPGAHSGSTHQGRHGRRVMAAAIVAAEP